MCIEDFQNLVIRLAEDGYRFSDTEYGFSKLNRDDIVEEKPGIAVARFRLQAEDLFFVRYFVKHVCETINDTPRLFVEKRESYGIPYLECIWVVVIDAGTKAEDVKETVEEELESRKADIENQDFDTSVLKGEDFA